MLNELIGAVVQVLLFALVPLIFWFVTARKKESFCKWIGLEKPACKETWKAVLLTSLVALLYIGAMAMCVRILPEGITTAGSMFAGQGISALPSLFFYAFLRTALSEELLFRGFILKRVQDIKGFAVGNIVQALLFGLMHGIPFGIVTRSISALFLLTLIPGLFGWYEGWLNEKRCGGSIVPGWMVHGCLNLLTGILSL